VTDRAVQPEARPEWFTYAPEAVKRCTTHHACACHEWMAGMWRQARAASQERPQRTTRMTLAQALIGSELIARLLEYSGTDDDPRDLAQSWAHRIADWLDEHDAGVAQERPPLMMDGLVYDEIVTERAASQERPQPPTWRQPTADEPGGRRNPSYETECGECGTRLRITNNYSPQGDFLDQSSEPVGVAQERPPIDVPPHPFIEVQRSPTHCLLFIEGGTCKQPPNAPIHGGGSVASPEPSDG
jgi:hypothetical protein